jgi:hypothetical protein
LVLVALPALAQDKAKVKVAEGEYQMHSKSRSGVPRVETVTRWVLTAKGTSGYHLESEIRVKPSGMRVLQVEDLDEQFAPTMIGYEFYSEGEQKPEITATCEFANRTIVCRGKSGEDQAEVSQPFQTSGPFWLWMEGLFLVDLPWLLDGAVNMAQLESGKVNIATITVSDGSGVSRDAVNVAKPEKVIKPDQKPTVEAQPSSSKAVEARLNSWQLAVLLQLDLADRHRLAVQRPGDCYLDVFLFLQRGDKLLGLVVAGSVKLDELLVVRNQAVSALRAVRHL